MNHENPAYMPGAHDDRDALISRVVDGCASGADWDRFRELASADSAVWGELAGAQQQFESLRESVGSAVSVADSVELPGGLVRHDRHERRLERVSRWGGWAAAAAILLVWVTGVRTSHVDPLSAGGEQVAGFGPSMKTLSTATPDEALDRYMTSGYQAGRVVGEIPNRIVVETRPMADGTYEVLYIRQILERRVLDEVYRETSDEFGNALALPVTGNAKPIKAF